MNQKKKERKEVMRAKPIPWHRKKTKEKGVSTPACNPEYGGERERENRW